MELFTTLGNRIDEELERREQEEVKKQNEKIKKEQQALAAEERRIQASEDRAKIKRKRLEKYGIKKQGGVLRYPAEALTEHTDYLQIDIERYEAIGDNYITSTGSSGRYVVGTAKQNRAGKTSSKKLAKKPLINLGSILLPIPANIEDSNNVVYGDSTLNGLAAAGVSAVETGMTTLGQAIAGTGNVDLGAIKSDC